MTSRSLLLLPLLLAVPHATDPSGQASQREVAEWPRIIDAPNGYSITLYQPQPERFRHDIITARAAMSIHPPTGEPIFGATWLTARLEADHDSRVAIIQDVQVTKVTWPEATDAQRQRYTEVVNAAFPKNGMQIDLDRLSASLATAEREERSLEGIKNTPPAIMVRNELSVLLQFDGEPRAMAIPETTVDQVINSAMAVFRDRGTGIYWLAGGTLWYSADDPMGPWLPGGRPPQAIASLVPPDDGTPAPRLPPMVVTVTTPTELIVTDGAPKWVALPGGQLLYIENTESPVLRTVDPGAVYLLVTGRWFRAPVLEGPWSFVRPDSLPASFADIPPESPIGSVRVSVPSTPEAEDAVLDMYIPQTAAVHRDSAHLTVTWDGAPSFQQIAGTKVEYGINTGSQVLRINGRYYACDNGVWFTSASATEGWIVADSIPEDEIKQIPPSEPVYNVTHVTVYESTPSVVYVGYTPGYTWSYPYYGVPIYGTGWYYPPYWGAVYYPHPVTYGMHVGYNPYMGWTYGYSWSMGFLTVGIMVGAGYGGYYHPGYGYGPGYYPPAGGGRYPPGYRPVATPYSGSGASIANRPATTRPSQLPAGTRPSNNVYGQAGTANRTPGMTPSTGAVSNGNRARPSTPNNLYAAPNGDVFRQGNNGAWDKRTGSGWQPDIGAGRGGQASTMNRDAQARQRGSSRASRGGGRRP